MGGIVWDPALDTGDALVDEQHRGLLELLNELDAVEDADMARIVAVLDRLEHGLAVHFATEEQYMAQLSYPVEATAAHVREHRLMAAKQSTMSIDYRRGWTAGTAPLVDYLTSWLSDHIQTQDRLLVEYVRAGR